MNQPIVNLRLKFISLDNEVNKDQPDQKYKIEYVYGYKSDDVRNNLHLTSSGHYIWQSAALGIIYDSSSNSQQFFGGGVVDNKAKNVSNDMNAHTDDVLSIKYNSGTN